MAKTGHYIQHRGSGSKKSRQQLTENPACKTFFFGTRPLTSTTVLCPLHPLPHLSASVLLITTNGRALSSRCKQNAGEYKGGQRSSLRTRPRSCLHEWFHGRRFFFFSFLLHFLQTLEPSIKNMESLLASFTIPPQLPSTPTPPAIGS